MGERAKITLNKYQAKEILKREDLNLDKFYSSDLKIMIEVLKEEIENLEVENFDLWEKCIELKNIISSAKEILKDTDINMESVLLIETIDHAIDKLNGEY